MTKNDIIVAKGVKKAFGDKKVLNGIDFKVTRGSVALFLGPNGVGKTTTLKSLVGGLNFKGDILIDGLDSKSADAKKVYSFVPDNSAFPKGMKTLTYLSYMGYLSGMSMKDSKKKSIEILKRLGMMSYAKKFPNKFSAGQRKTINIAQALLLDPELIIMDEPSANLDIDAKARLIRMIDILNKEGKTFFISTHAIRDFQEIATEVVVLHNGKVFSNKKVKKGSDLLKLYEDAVGLKYA